MEKVNWGVLSTANIGIQLVIPAMQKGMFSEVNAIASRNKDKALKAAEKLSIPKAYGSYEDLLTDKDIDAVYIPLPNHLHVEWAIKCMEAGKHVLLEKPIGLNYREALQLEQAAKKFPKIKIMEAFMYRHHPQILEVKRMIDDGEIGEIRSIYSAFSYFNDNPADIRNQPDIGGGGLLDIGCYCISLSRFMFRSEPIRVNGIVEFDPNLKVDRLASGIIEFQEGQAVFMCSTQMYNQQYAAISGTKAKIEIEIPFNPPIGKATKINIHKNDNFREINFDPCNQYTIQGDLFSNAIINNIDPSTPLKDGVANMQVIDAIFKSAEKGKSVDL
jgi:predicted dehydrogenase